MQVKDIIQMKFKLTVEIFSKSSLHSKRNSIFQLTWTSLSLSLEAIKKVDKAPKPFIKNFLNLQSNSCTFFCKFYMSKIILK